MAIPPSIFPPRPVINTSTSTHSHSHPPLRSHRQRRTDPQPAFLQPRAPVPSAPSLPALRHRAAALESSLQHLLDAQSDGLLLGLGRAPDSASRGGSTNDGSDTPTGSVSASSSRGRRRRSYDGSLIASTTYAKPVIKGGLRGVRRGILACIRELADVKAAEGKLLAEDQEVTGEVVARIETWRTKREGLDQKVRAIAEEERIEDGVSGLEKEERQITAEIQELEIRLAQLKTRQRLVRGEIEQRRNAAEAKISSYKASKEIVEGQIRAFLKHPPSPVESLSTEERQTVSKGFKELPFSRRTLELAETHYRGLEEALLKSVSDIDTERRALDAGAEAWKEVISRVSTIEKRLRALLSKTSLSMIDVSAPPGTDSADDELRTIRSLMDDTLEDLESRLHFAEESRWNLLVCCIGAEVEALREGREVLLETLGESTAEEGSHTRSIKGKARETGPIDSFGIELKDVTPVAEQKLPDTASGQSVDDRSESEDDGPGPDLLYEKHDGGDC